MRQRETIPCASAAGRLAKGPAAGLGAANAIARESLADGAKLNELVEALADARGLVRHRAANALKKMQREDPVVLEPFTKQILDAAAKEQDLRARWNLVEVLGHLPLKGRNRALALELLFEAMRDESAILRANAMQSLADQAILDPKLLPRMLPIVRAALEDPGAAMRARARRLLRSLQRLPSQR
ncbi:hypothetical protein [Bryocella elongata]|uniref:hypothetical protein n=1 Tax=Bryocella elongata TaxID=863522 RepID=UPI0011AFE854|nr:hypothetical protein [Bryocella elongata]